MNFKSYLKEIKMTEESKRLAEYLEDTSLKKIIYGAGQQAFICYDILNRFNIPVDSFMTTDGTASWKGVLPNDVPILTPDSYSGNKDECVVILALNNRYQREVTAILKENGYSHICPVNNWNEVNDIFRGAFVDCFLEDNNAFIEDDVIVNGKFRIYRGKNLDNSYRTMLEGDFFDIIAPSVFRNEEYCREGGYEIEELQVADTDIVFDLGANVGMFANSVAWKCKKVYAFEPTPNVARMTKLNADLYENISVEEYAVSDSEGTASFSVSVISEENSNTGGNTLYAERLGGTDTDVITVKTIDLDTFVKKNNVESIDFIKADIEGAERYMLMGAMEVLKEYEPKLSLCTYHLPDDEEVLTELIMKANPKYKIIYGEKKLYAFVEK